MKLYHLSQGPLRVNTYFLVNEDTNEAIVIDSGENYKKIKLTEQTLGIKIKAVLLTHAHFDHAGNAKQLQNDGAKVYISKKDFNKLLNEENLASDFGRKFEYVTADFTFEDNQELDICGIKIKTILTPGHTDGSACFIVNNMLFTGDTLFLESVGRTDFYGGNEAFMIQSIKKLAALPKNYRILAGHGEETTLEMEKQHNPYFIEYA